MRQMAKRLRAKAKKNGSIDGKNKIRQFLVTFEFVKKFEKECMLRL